MNIKGRIKVFLLVSITILFVFFIFIVYWYIQPLFPKTNYIEPLGINVRIERLSLLNKKARVSFSKTDDFGSDYIVYEWYPDGPGLNIYVMNPNLYYVIGYNYKIYEIKTDNIQIINKDITTEKDYSREKDMNGKDINIQYRQSMQFINLEDSLQKNADYIIQVWGSQWIEIWKPSTKKRLFFKDYP